MLSTPDQRHRVGTRALFPRHFTRTGSVSAHHSRRPLGVDSRDITCDRHGGWTVHQNNNCLSIHKQRGTEAIRQ